MPFFLSAARSAHSVCLNRLCAIVSKWSELSERDFIHIRLNYSSEIRNWCIHKAKKERKKFLFVSTSVDNFHIKFTSLKHEIMKMWKISDGKQEKSIKKNEWYWLSLPTFAQIHYGVSTEIISLFCFLFHFGRRWQHQSFDLHFSCCRWQQARGIFYLFFHRRALLANNYFLFSFVACTRACIFHWNRNYMRMRTCHGQPQCSPQTIF